MYSIISEKYVRMAIDSGGVLSAVKQVEIMCDTSADIPEPLPEWEIGSYCFIIDTQDVKFLNSQGEWV